MTPYLRHDTPTGNWLLDALPAADFERLKPHLIKMPLSQGRILFEEGEPVSSVYFPTQGMVSLVLPAHDGHEVEVAVVGPEGAVGIAGMLGYGKALSRAVVQIAGKAYCMPADVLHAEARSGTIQSMLNCYLQFLIHQSFHTTLCNRLHKTDERLARWLLTARDRAQSAKLPLTHELISAMLGTRRASITEACSALAAAGLIKNTRGSITILDEKRLETRACECYAVIRDEMKIVYDAAPTHSH